MGAGAPYSLDDITKLQGGQVPFVTRTRSIQNFKVVVGSEQELHALNGGGSKIRGIFCKLRKYYLDTLLFAPRELGKEAQCQPITPGYFPGQRQKHSGTTGNLHRMYP
jgi:hypothetical protein